MRLSKLIIFSFLLTGSLLPGLPAAADEAADSFHLRKYASIEAAYSSTQGGQFWRSDFDRGWQRSHRGELGIDGGLEATFGDWTGQLSWRGRYGEHLPVRGRFDEVWISRRWSHFNLRAGRGYIDWSPMQGTAILFSENARAIDFVQICLTDLPLPLPLLGGRLEAENLLGYLDDGNRTVPYPMMWGMRLSWLATDWLRVEAQRSIMLGGGGRSQQLSVKDLWRIFCGRGEADMIETDQGLQFGHADTDQKFAWLLQLHPRDWVRRHLGIDDLDICITYGGEDRFERFVPMAPCRAYAVRLHPNPSLAISYIDIGNRDDFNHWYWHKIYRSGYTNRGVVIGHPMGGEAQSWRLAVFYAPLNRGRIYFGRVIRESHGPLVLKQGQWTKRSYSGFYRSELGVSIPVGRTRPYFVAGIDKAWGDDQMTVRLANWHFRIGIEFWGSEPGGKLGAREIWGRWL